MNHTDMFGCRYPIIAAPMNKVSDLKLAIACHHAGIFPSLSLYTFYVIDTLRLDLFDAALKEYKLQTGTNKILVSILTSDALNKTIQDILINNSVSHLEIIDDKTIVNNDEWDTIIKEIQFLQDCNIKIFFKALTAKNTSTEIDGIILKSSTGAGRGAEYVNIDTELANIKQNYPNIPVVMSGGITCSADIQKYLELGCIAVAIGTLFAAAAESPISKDSKQKMIDAKYSDVVRFGKANQNALIFKPIPNDDHNNTESLIHGMKDPSKGIIFAGKGIDAVSEILPVADIVNELVKDLKL